MSGEHLVVGAGRDATLVAAALAAEGASVTLVQTAPPIEAPLACTEGATWKEEPLTPTLEKEVVGPVSRCSPSRFGVVASGATHPLPLSTSTLGRILPAGQRRLTARSFVRARARNALATVVGGGQEERSYRDWVVRRMGAPAYALLYADYAERRWGISGDELSVSLARVVHGTATTGVRVRPVDPLDFGVRRAETLLEAAGAPVVRSEIRRFHLEGGAVATVELDDAFLDAKGKMVWTTLSPHRVADCLGSDCPPAARHLAAGLRARPACRVRLSGARQGIPDEVHVLDPAPCWRFVRAPDNPSDWIASVSAPLSAAILEDVRDFAVQQNLVDPGSEVVASANVPGGVPTWGRVDHARLRPVLEAWGALGIVLTGSGGTLTPLDPPSVLAHVAHIRQNGASEIQEAWRTIAAPPTRVEDLGANITQFFAGV